MPLFDLTELKTGLGTSMKAMDSLGSTFSKLAPSSESSVLPELSKIGDAVSNTVGSLGRAISGIGDAIIGESIKALPKMQSMMENLIPDTSKLSSLCDSVKEKVASGIASITPALEATIDGIKAESENIKATAQKISESMDSEKIKAPTELEGVIKNMSSIVNTMSDFASKTSQAIFDPVTVKPPSYTQINESIKIDELLTTANRIKDVDPGFSTGEITSNLYKAVGTMREVGARISNKLAAYQKAQLEMGQQADETSAEIGPSINTVRGTSPEQDISI